MLLELLFVGVVLSLAPVFLVSLFSFLFHYVMNNASEPQSMWKVFGARWALVTGGSSGIGAALCEELCKQGVNVFIVAKKDDMLTSTTQRLKTSYPDRDIRSIGVDLGDRSGLYLDEIAKVTEGLPINLVFNNAGYIRIGIFADDPLEASLHNTEVNLLSAIRVTHLFTNRMLNEGLKGAICFTSSATAMIPAPMSAIYGGGKAFLTGFASSLAAELRPCGIDVMVIHPSPTDTGFYANSNGLSFMLAAQKTAVTPESVAKSILGSLGRTVVKDDGYFSIGTKLLLKVLDYNVLADIIAGTSYLVKDYWNLKKARPLATQ